jgi:hypothetical protein
MDEIAVTSTSGKTSERWRLRRVRYFAEKHALRVTRAVSGFSLIAGGVEPQRPIVGLVGVDLATIEVALGLPPLNPAALTDIEVDRLVEAIGGTRLLEALDRLTRPAIRAAAE